MERKFDLSERSFDRARALAEGYRQKGFSLMHDFDLGRRLGLGLVEQEIFHAGLAYYLASKEGAEDAFEARSPHSKAVADRPILGFFARKLIERDQIRSAAAYHLKEQSEYMVTKCRILYDIGDLPQNIVNASNFVSSLYRECLKQKLDFNEELDKRVKYLKDKVINFHS